MTFDEYVVNPMGRSNAVMSAVARESQRNSYKRRFDNLLLRENGRIDYLMYKSDNEVYFIHIKIPSETVNDFYYDVVIKFMGDVGTAAGLKTLDRYQVQFYSNDPAFVYTYAYVFKKVGLLIPELEPRMAKKALNTPAEEKNPYNQVGYVKTIYFAYLFMKYNGLFNKVKFTAAPKFSKRLLLSNVENADEKIRKRQELGEELKRRKKTTVSRSYNKAKNELAPKGSSSTLQVSATKKVGVANNKAGNVKKTKSAKKF